MRAKAKERPLLPDEDRTGDPIVAERLRARAAALGLTREAIAAAFIPPINYRTAGTYLTGKRDPSTHRKRELARILETTVAYLVGETDDYRTPEVQLLALGIGPGNLQQLGDEDLSSTIVGLVQEMRKRALKRTPPPPQGGAPDADAGTDAAARTS